MPTLFLDEAKKRISELEGENKALRSLIAELIAAIPRAHLPIPVGPSFSPQPPANPLDALGTYALTCGLNVT